MRRSRGFHPPNGQAELGWALAVALMQALIRLGKRPSRLIRFLSDIPLEYGFRIATILKD